MGSSPYSYPSLAEAMRPLLHSVPYSVPRLKEAYLEDQNESLLQGTEKTDSTLEKSGLGDTLVLKDQLILLL